MSVTAFFERFVGIQQQRTQTAIASYRELVAGIATGEEPNPADVERLLAETGKSVDQLRKDVENYQRRMELKARAAEVPELQAELLALDDKIAAADRALKVAEELHDETTNPLHFRRQQVNAAINEADRARHELVETCDDPGLRRELAELTSAINSAGERINGLYERERYMSNQAHTERENAKSEHWTTEGERRLELAQKYQANSDAACRGIKEAEKEMANLEKRREELEVRMRKF
jgi:hypothetical protein